jgi:hypothetical protein
MKRVVRADSVRRGLTKIAETLDLNWPQNPRLTFLAAQRGDLVG